MLDKLLLQIASDLCSFCHLGNFVGEIPAGRKGNNLFTAETIMGAFFFILKHIKFKSKYGLPSHEHAKKSLISKIKIKKLFCLKI